MAFQKGDKVLANGKPGVVAYVRLAPPDYSEPCAISVILDEKWNSLGYCGTIFSPEQVEVNDAKA